MFLRKINKTGRSLEDSKPTSRPFNEGIQRFADDTNMHHLLTDMNKRQKNKQKNET